MTTTAPWEQMPGESAKAYRAFSIYRDLGSSRSLDQASRLYHQRQRDADDESRRPPRASGTIRQWAQHWNWPARALAWDRQLQRFQQAEQVAAMAEMAQRHIKEAMMLQSKAVERLRLLRPEELKPLETLDYLIEAAKLERLARGQPTERVAEEHTFTNLKELTDDELARIIACGLPPSGGPGTVWPPNGPQKPL